MTKKITKEQAEWLVEKIQAESSAHYASPFLLDRKSVV